MFRRRDFKLKKIIISLLIILILPLHLLVACNDNIPADNDNVLALSIVLGRHANANAFPEVYYQEIIEDVQNAVYGGFISIIISDGSPKEIPLTDEQNKAISFATDANNKTVHSKKITERTEAVMAFIKDENNRAVSPENDLLHAIKEARASLNHPNVSPDAEKKIIVLDTCISTSGDFRIQDLKLDTEKPESQDVLSKLSETEGTLPDLTNINLRIIGLGDVAEPQNINDETKIYIKTLWETILKHCGAKINDLDILIAGLGGRNGISSGSKANVSKDDGGDYPPVTVVNIISKE